MPDIRVTYKRRTPEGAGVEYEALLTHDGRLIVCASAPCRWPINIYMHPVDRDVDTYPPTEAQRAFIATQWLGNDINLCITPANRICVWAFAGLTPEEVSKRYGDGKPVYLA